MSSRNRRILIVDDNPAIHDDFRKILCPEGSGAKELEESAAELFGSVSDVGVQRDFELDFASQGAEALAAVQRALKQGRPYALVFMDVRMPPGWDGIKTTARLWEEDCALQVVLCTAYSDYSWTDLVRDLKHRDRFVILKKPFDMIEVLQLATAFTDKWNLARQVEARARLLQQSEQRYRLLANALPGMVWTATPDGMMDYANQWLEQFTGKSAEILAGKGWQSVLHPDDLAECLGRWKQACETGQEYRMECRLLQSNGAGYRWHAARAIPMRDEQGRIVKWIGACADIEDQKQAEEVLRQARADLESRVFKRTQELSAIRARLEHLLRSSPAIIYSVRLGPQPQVVFLSSNVTRALGHTPAQFIDDPRFWLDHIHPEDAAEIPAHCARLLATGHHPLEYRFRHRDGTYRWMHDDARVVRNHEGTPVELVGSWTDVTGRKGMEEELRAQRESFRALTESSPDGVTRIDHEFRFVYVNREAENRIGIPASALLGKTNRELGLPAQDQWNHAVRRVFQTGEMEAFEFADSRNSDDPRYLEARLLPEYLPNGEVQYVISITRDITRQKKAEKQRQIMEVQLRQAQKLESIGQLAAGIAHEINTPTQYVGDNTRFLKDSFGGITELLRACEELREAARSGSVPPELLARVEMLRQSSDLDYLFEQIPAAIQETLEGVERVSRIVRAMKEFSHPGGKEKSPADLNKAIESTVTVARNEWKYVADLELDLDPQLPAVPCFLGEFNQVILNLVINAAHALADVAKTQSGEKGRILIRTRRDGQQAEIRVSDTGTGIPEAIQPKIFEPFFTTKPVGKGTGQGLAIVYGTVVQKHGGSVAFETQPGHGTTFILRLPLALRGPKEISGAKQAEEADLDGSNSGQEAAAGAVTIHRHGHEQEVSDTTTNP